jgi:hypothetical protein
MQDLPEMSSFKLQPNTSASAVSSVTTAAKHSAAIAAATAKIHIDDRLPGS